MSPKLTVLTIFLVVFGLAYLAAFLRMAANRDQEWEARWKQLPTADRRRIWRAVRRGEKLEDPDEARLAAGSARFQRQLIWHPTAGAWTMLAIFTVAALAVALNGNLPLLGIALAGLGFAAWRLTRSREVVRNLARSEELNQARARGPA